MSNNGWIKLNRQVLDWEWYQDNNTFKLFIHCLLKANHVGKKWRGIFIERGQFVSSYDILSNETSLSYQQVRTSLSKLKSTGELTVKSTSKYSLISVNKYNIFQAKEDIVTDESTDNLTVKQQSSNSQVTTTKNIKNNKNEKNNEYSENFLIFWSKIYTFEPSKKGSKKKAYVSWGKNVKDKDIPLLKRIEKAVKIYKEQEQVENGYIQHASTWINNRMWETILGE